MDGKIHHLATEPKNTKMNVPKNIVISSEQYIGRAVLAVQMHCLLESKL